MISLTKSFFWIRPSRLNANLCWWSFVSLFMCSGFSFIGTISCHSDLIWCLPSSKEPPNKQKPSKNTLLQAEILQFLRPSSKPWTYGIVSVRRKYKSCGYSSDIPILHRLIIDILPVRPTHASLVISINIGYPLAWNKFQHWFQCANGYWAVWICYVLLYTTITVFIVYILHWRCCLKSYGNNNLLRKDKPSLRCHLRSMDKTYGSSHVSIIPIAPLAVESHLKTCIALGFQDYYFYLN
jgi:hypothetical protein